MARLLRSVFEVVQAADDVVHCEKFLLLVELEKNYFFVKFANVISPGLELLPLDARGVAGGSRVREPLNFDKLLASLAKEATRTKVF